MKKFMLSWVAMIVCSIAIAQNEYKKSPTFGFHFTLNDFQGADYIRNNNLSNALKNNELSNTSEMASGLAFSYTEGWNKYLDFNATLTGSYLAYPIPNKEPSNEEALLLELAATANLKLVPDNYWLVPYITAGIGASKYKGYYGAFVPIGVGIQFKILPNTFILVNAQYRIPATENVAYHFYYGFGVAQSFPRKVAPPPVEVVIPVAVVVDKDGDGILDVNDKCPDIPGLATLQGCPDKDGDGITDTDDKCPTTPGLAKYQGCPIPDTDGDGINDEQDQCITVSGLARYQGCPIPDTDGDGINDEEDKCPKRAGVAANLGCPEITFYYKRAVSELSKEDKSLLDSVVRFMNNNPTLNIIVEGYTSNTGTEKFNQTLSEKRAANSVKYLISKGIDKGRLSSVGYGETRPVEGTDQSKDTGRAANRRSVMRINAQ